MDFHATWWSGHVSSIKTDQMIGGARPHRNHCAQLGEWMPANHYASKWDATSKKVQATSAKRAHLLRELTANIYYSNSAVKYPTCYQNSTLKGGKPGLWKNIGIILLVFVWLVVYIYWEYLTCLARDIPAYFSKIIPLIAFLTVSIFHMCNIGMQFSFILLRLRFIILLF